MSLPGELDNWPWCPVCSTPVVAYEIVNAGNTYIEVMARCHGKEDVLRIEWPWYFPCMNEDIQYQIARLPFFKYGVAKYIRA